MNGLAALVDHWGYAAVFTVVVLGNVGLPVPEETILTLAGYLVWRGDLELWRVLVVGIVSASMGDNAGYWLGRRLGTAAVDRYGTRVGISEARLSTSRDVLAKYGALAIFVARFLPGFRFAAGPVAGTIGMPMRVFFIANVLGACVYVPVVVGVGYALGRSVGPHLEQAGAMVTAVEHVVLAAALIVTLCLLLIRAARRRARTRRAQ